MTLNDFLKMCKKKDWKALKGFLPCDIKDSSIKIVASAMFETYHSDLEIRNEYNLNIWNKYLYNDFYSDMAALFCSYVNLLDFFKAYCIVKNPVDSTETYAGLGDELLAQTIRNYVIHHQMQLAGILKSDVPEQEGSLETWNHIKNQIKDAFGDLTLTVDNDLNQTQPKYTSVRSQTLFGNSNTLKSVEPTESLLLQNSFSGS